MNDVTIAELRAHLVLHLSPDRLLRQNGTQVRVRPGREVQGPHYFLLLHRQVDGRWFVTPTFSGPGPGNLALDANLKSGTAHAWLGIPTFVSRFQQWLARPEALINALENDNSTFGNRRTYADGNPAEISRLINEAAANQEAFREIAP